MKTGGYIRLWRKITETSFYKKPKTAHLAIFLLLEANHKPFKMIYNQKELIIERGQLVTGLYKLRRMTGLSIQNIRTSLKILANIGFLTSKSTSELTIINVCNYNEYQQEPTSKLTSKLTNDQQTTNKRLTTIQEGEEGEEGEENNNSNSNSNSNNEEQQQRKKPAKIKHGDDVYLTLQEFEKLKVQFGKSGANERIERLDTYIGSTGKKYKSHYKTILNWEGRNYGAGKNNSGYGFKGDNTAGQPTTKFKDAGIPD